MRLIQTGSRQAKIFLVGEAPGQTEDQTGVPFSGGSGELLNRVLDRAGIRRDECFITNVCHERPPKNDFNWFLKPKPKIQLIQGLQRLKADLDEIQPNVIVALGAQPLRFLANKQGIDKWRGSVLPCTLSKGLKVIGTYHPAYALRVWDYKAIIEFDLKRVRAESLTKDIIRPARGLILNPDHITSLGLVEELLTADWLAVDIECTEIHGGWRLSCVGFSDRASRAVVWPCDEAWKLGIIKTLCESRVAKVFQNGTFDVTVLADNGIVVPWDTFKWDTMLGHHSLFPECASGADEMAALGGKKRQSALAKGLAFQVSIYTSEPFYKDDGKLWRETDDKEMFWRYNALDAATTREIRDVQEIELVAFGTRQVLDHEMSLVEPLAVMTRRGVLIDMQLRAELGKKYETEIARLQKALDTVMGSPVNVKSSPQMLKLLYEHLKLPVKYHRETKRPTASKDAIIELSEKHSHPVLAMILQIRQRRDFVERYINAQVDADGRMRCAYDITGTRTGRLSSRQSIYGSGTNLQNIPSRRPEGEAIRRMFIADPGKVMIGRDYSQAEARIVAQLANCRGLIELFNDPTRDIHKENAARIFEKPLSEITSEERYLAKRVVHAANYGMMAPRLAQVVNEDAPYTGVRITVQQAQQLLQKYFMMYPEIREVFWKTVQQEMRHSRTLNTPFGRKRTFFGRWDDKLMREAYSYIPQSTVGDLGCKALVNCYWQIEKQVHGAELLLQVHDAVYMQCYESDALRVATMMEEAMAIPIQIHGREFTIPTDAKIGRNWGSRPKTAPEQNPHGMVDIKLWAA